MTKRPISSLRVPNGDSLYALGSLLYELGYQNYLKAEQADPEDRLKMLRDNQPILKSAIRRHGSR